jgi:phosphoribosylformimino-5-aminoimidazole carboxamide ribotide isomerase
MLLIPSIDLRGGHCVRLLKGEFNAETRYALDALALLERYAGVGLPWLHLVDLDGARDGRPGNQELIGRLAGAQRMKIQLGGGLRDAKVVASAFAMAVDRVVIGSAAVDNPTLLGEVLAERGPEAVCLAIDVRVDAGGTPRVRTRGWVKEHALSLWELLERPSSSGLRHVLCTDVERDGALTGPSNALYTQCLARFPQLRWQASGGVRSVADLTSLARLGMAAAISGKALLEGHLKLEELQPYLRDA